MRQFFRDYARAIQDGGPEYVRSERFLNIYWPADEFILIQLVADGEIDAFYEQAQAALLSSARRRRPMPSAPVLADAVRLNQALLKRPFTRDTLSVPLHYNVWEYYRGALVGEPTAITERPALLAIDRDAAVVVDLGRLLPRGDLVRQQEGRLPVRAPDGGRIARPGATVGAAS